MLELLETAKEKPAEGPASFFRWATDVLDLTRYLTKEDKDARYVDELHAAAERAQREGLSLATFLEELAVEEPAEDEHDERVTLSTVHRAKGLEWQHVIVLGLDEGTWPTSKVTTEEEQEEERRCLYVGVSRTKESLRILWTEGHQSPLLRGLLMVDEDVA